MKNVKSAAHAMESLLENVRKGHVVVTPEIKDLSFTSIDFLKKSLRIIECEGDDRAVGKEAAQLEAILSNVPVSQAENICMEIMLLNFEKELHKWEKSGSSNELEAMDKEMSLFERRAEKLGLKDMLRLSDSIRKVLGRMGS